MMHRPILRLAALALPALLAAVVLTACSSQESAPPAGTTPPAAEKPAEPAAPPSSTPPAPAASEPGRKPAAAGPAAEATGEPQLVIETERGIIAVDLFPDEAPKSVEQILRLAKRGFYRNQRIHRVVPGQIVQFGDPQSRDGTLREWWGRGPRSGSGQPVGTAEISKTRKHRPGTVGLAHAGDADYADSQIYITMRDMPNLDGKFTIIGQVMSGLPVLGQIKVGDVVKQVSAGGGPGS